MPGLVSSGMTLAAAISAMLIYRLVSWIFISAIGWVVFFFMFRTETDVDPDAGLDEVDQSEAVSDAEPAPPDARSQQPPSEQQHRGGGRRHHEKTERDARGSGSAQAASRPRPCRPRPLRRWERWRWACANPG